MDETGSTTVSNSTATLNLQPGEFRILGNTPTTVLSVDDNEIPELTIYPNPTRTSFRVNTNASFVEVFDITGKLVKAFKGSFTPLDEFDMTDLKTGIYVVKIESNNNRSMTSKLVKI